MASHERPRPPGPGRSLKPLIAGVLVLTAGIGGLAISGLYIAAPHWPALLGSTGELSGEVKNSTGGAVQGASVRVAGMENVTNESGFFRISGVPTGRQEVLVEAEGYRTLEFITLVGAAQVRLSLRLKEGNGTEVVDEHPQQVNALYTCGAVTLLFSVIALSGAIFALRRRRYPIALTGAMVGLAIPPFPVMTALCLIAVALLIFSRGEFG